MNNAAEVGGGALGLTAACEVDAQVTGWSVDSRTLRPGDLYFALRGPHHDGHAYVAEVLEKGAVAVVVDRDVAVSRSGSCRSTIRCGALQTLASLRRAGNGAETWSAVTGSAGKTTTKDVIAEMLAAEIETAKTEGNLNNHVGLPLSLLRIDGSGARRGPRNGDESRAARFAQLAEIARPDVGVVTNVGYAHMENFDSIEGIAAAKRELIEALALDGTAVLNADDARVAAFAERASRAGRFSTANPTKAQVRAEDVKYYRATACAFPRGRDPL